VASDVLLDETDPPPFQVFGAQGRSPFVLSCDHAGRLLPKKLGDLGVAASELTRHIAWDIGAAGLARALCKRLDAVLIEQTYSRLVIDVNRPPGAPDSIVTLSEHTAIPGNVGLEPAAARQRELEIFQPYHRRIAAEVDARVAAGGPLVLVAVHSFTPRFKNVDREWHAGVLYGRDTRFAHHVLRQLRADPLYKVGDNEPYAVSDDTDFTVVVHAERRGIPYVELEIRQDLIADEPGQQEWSERLARALALSFSALFPS
jgi:predicted N-formylglutamate amidohydrolase